MKVFALTTFVLPGGQLAEQGEVYDLPTGLAIEAITLGNCSEFTPPPEPDPTPEPEPKPKKKG